MALNENVTPNVKDTKKRVILTLEMKMKVLEQIDKGKKQYEIAEMFGISRQMVGYIGSNRKKFRAQYELVSAKHPEKKSKRYSRSEDSILENILYSWFCQNWEAGIPVGGNLLKEKALTFNQNLIGDSNFVASAGWLARFKERHGIRQLSIQGEKLSADSEGSEHFSREFQTFIEKEGFDLNHIYNADETGLHWKELPRKTRASARKTNAAGLKVAKDRVTVMTCANASGTHKIPLLVIGKYKQPRCMKGVEKLPLVYTNQRNSWMDATVFHQWYSTVFLPAIKSTMKNEEEKFLLLLDIAPSHSSAEELNAIDPCCVVKYFPPNMTSLIQPMHQGVTISMKRHYKRMYLRELLLDEETEGPEKYKGFLKNWNLLHCIRTLSSAWECIEKSTIVNAWSNLLCSQHGEVSHREVNDDEICHLANRAMQMSISLEETRAWLNNDNNDCGWHVDSVEEIASTITGNNFQVDSDIDKDVEEEEEEDERHTFGTDTTNQVLEMDAYRGADSVYKWLQMRKDVTAEDLVTAARLRNHIGDVIADKKLSM